MKIQIEKLMKLTKKRNYKVFESSTYDNPSLRVPSNVCVILDEEMESERLFELSYLIADVLNSMGIKSLNFYRFQGFSKEIQVKVSKKFDSKDLNNNKNWDKNQGGDIDVKFLCYRNGGREILVQSCRYLACIKEKEGVEYKDLIDKNISRLTNLKDPELVIKIGSNDSLTGFSPWHLRLAEIIKIPSHTLVSKSTLYETIIKYGNIEKRLGK